MNYQLHPREIWNQIIIHLDAGLIVGSAIAGSALLLTAGTLERSPFRSYYFGGTALVALSGKRARKIMTRTGTLMTLIDEESAVSWQGFFKGQFSPTAQLAEAELLEAADIMPTDLSALGQKNTLIIGESGSGKSTIAKALAARFGGKLTIIDPHNKKRDWGELPVVGGGRNFEAIDHFLAGEIAEIDNRYKLRNLGADDYQMEVSIIDEGPAIAANTENWRPYIKITAREARKVLKPAIVLVQDENAKTLDIEGETVLREGFDRLYLGRLAMKRAKALKNDAVLAWLKQQKRPALLNDEPCSIKDLSELTLSALPPLPALEESKPATTREAATESDPEPAQSQDLRDADSSAATTDADAEYTLFLAIQEHLENGKSKTWIVENILRCKSRKFKGGMTRLNSLIERFGGDE